MSTRIRWKVDAELQVMENEHDSYLEAVQVDELDDVDIVDDYEKTVDIQFACGDVTYGIPKDYFEIVKK